LDVRADDGESASEIPEAPFSLHSLLVKVEYPEFSTFMPILPLLVQLLLVKIEV
jgi:hypothetical protein